MDTKIITDCPHCGARLNMKNRIGNSVRCEYCDSDILLENSPTAKSVGTNTARPAVAPPPQMTEFQESEYSKALEIWNRKLKIRKAVLFSTVTIGTWCVSQGVYSLFTFFFFLNIVLLFTFSKSMAVQKPRHPLEKRPDFARRFTLFLKIFVQFYVPVILGFMAAIAIYVIFDI